MTLDRYFAWRFFWIFVSVFAIFVLILGFVGIVDQLRRFSDTDASFVEVLTLTALSLPIGVYGILPLIMIIATIALFLGLARSSEMVVTRAAGRGALRAMVPPIVVALAIGVVAVAVMNPIVASTSRQYEARSDQLKGEGSILSIGASGLWLSQGDQTSQTVIRAESANLDGTVLSDVTFLSFSSDGLPISRIAAQRAELWEGMWQLSQAKIWPLSRGLVPEA